MNKAFWVLENDTDTNGIDLLAIDLITVRAGSNSLRLPSDSLPEFLRRDCGKNFDGCFATRLCRLSVLRTPRHESAESAHARPWRHACAVGRPWLTYQSGLDWSPHLRFFPNLRGGTRERPLCAVRSAGLPSFISQVNDYISWSEQVSSSPICHWCEYHDFHY